jgi:ribonuclease P protein component
MLGSLFRFHGYGSLRYLYKQGRFVRGQNLSIRFAHNPRRQQSRLAVVVTRKVCKSAPKRNRIRRRIYEVMRTQWQHIPPAHDMVITIFEPRFYDMPHDELQQAVISALKRARLWQSKTSQKEE